MNEQELEAGPGWLRWAGLVAGVLAAGAAYTLLPRETTDAAAPGLSHAARATAAVAVLMAIWWLTEALPLEATALLPLVLFPLLGVLPIKETAAPYANEVIFLFLGGLILGMGLERWNMHRRIALTTMRLVGTSPAMLVLGVMLATALISTVVSNTAAAVMMLPIGTSVVAMVEAQAGPRDRSGFAPCLLLGIAYAASIGGVGTLVGTPPNAILAAFAEQQDLQPPMTFARWLLVGPPILAVFLPLAWLIMTRVVFRLPRARVAGLSEAIGAQHRALGPMTRSEVSVLAVFLAAAVLWVFRGPLVSTLGLRVGSERGAYDRITDAGIAIGAALLLFLIPVDRRRRIFVMDWAHASRLPWGVLILFGGGLSLAEAISTTKLDLYLGRLLGGLAGLPPALVVLIVTASMVFLTEFASNTAVATAFMPIAISVAHRLGMNPYMLMFPVAVGASYAFMMPMGTPPNALVFATGRITIRRVAATGLLLNLAAIAVITAASCWLVPRVLAP